jgi:Leucine-rich repeat (LRR) protein
MKNILLLFAFIFLLQTVNAQYVTIPDSNLRVRLKELYPSCFDVNGRMDTTCDQVVNERDLFLDGYFITSLEGIEYFRNLRELWCSNNYLTSLPVLPKTLKRLICNNNRLSSLPELPELLEDLTCSHNLLTSLPELPVLLNKLWCENNQLTVLPSLPTAIKSIFCRDNQLTSLPMLPPTLDLLVCNNNQLTSLPSLPDVLTNLYCENNRLTLLPELPPSIYGLYCYNNELLSLPELPPALVDLYCYNNRLTSLPRLPASLTNLHCSNNSLTMLPELPRNLEKLTCNYNKLTSLPVLAASILELGCNYNQLSSLPTLPVSLREFDCSHNQLTSLPALPGTMYTMNCSYNQLTSLPVFTFLSSLFCNNNPLYCLPVLPNGLEELIIKNTRISCMPNVPLYLGYADTILPICTNASDVCPVNPFVQGIIYNDINNNGVFDTVSEQLMSQQIVKAAPNNWLGTSDENGIYWLKLDTVINNSWSLINDNSYVTITPNSYSLADIHNLGLQPVSYDFGIHLIPDVKDLETVLGSGPARPGFTTSITVTVNNIGTVSQSDITMKFKKPNGFNFISASVGPADVIDDTLIWNNISINYLEHQSINIQLQVPVNAVLGIVPYMKHGRTVQKVILHQ